MKDREIVSSRRQLEQWDTLLKEKDRKIGIEQKHLEEKEETLRIQENKIRSRESDLEKKVFELRQKDSEMTIMIEKYQSLRGDLEHREKLYQEQAAKVNQISSNLLVKESSLNSKELELKNLELKYVNLNKQENELNEKANELKKAMNDFYSYEVKGITTRHSNEIKRLEEIHNQQQETVKNLQSKVDKLRDLLEENEKEKIERKKKENEMIILIEKLESEVKEIEEERDGLKEQLSETFVRFVTETFLIMSRRNQLNWKPSHPRRNHHNAIQTMMMNRSTMIP